MQDASLQSQPLKVVVTFLPIYWFTKAVAGDAAKVEILVPPETEVHEYQATPTNVQAIATADVLVENGLGLKKFLEMTVKNAGNNKLKEINSSKGITTLAESPVVTVDTATDSDRTHEQEKDEANPHIWLDPV